MPNATASTIAERQLRAKQTDLQHFRKWSEPDSNGDLLGAIQRRLDVTGVEGPRVSRVSGQVAEEAPHRGRLREYLMYLFGTRGAGVDRRASVLVKDSGHLDPVAAGEQALACGKRKTLRRSAAFPSAVERRIYRWISWRR
jgi:hypothetical protein